MREEKIKSYLVQIEARDAVKCVAGLTEALVVARSVDALPDISTRIKVSLALIDVLTERVA